MGDMRKSSTTDWLISGSGPPAQQIRSRLPPRKASAQRQAGAFESTIREGAELLAFEDQ